MTDEADSPSGGQDRPPITEKIAPVGSPDRAVGEGRALREQLAAQDRRIAALEARLARHEEERGAQSSVKRFLASARHLSPVTVTAVATTAALVLGLSLYSLVRSAQWRAAIADLRTEPGIALLDVSSARPFRRQLTGLRDPLAPTVEEILVRHGLGAGAARLFFTEFHSLHTAYAEERRKQSEAEVRDLHDSLLTVVGEFAKEAERRSAEDLEKLTRAVLEARFPVEMKSVDVRFRGRRWQFRGGLYEPEHSLFTAEAPAFLVRGERNFTGLANLTEIESARLVDAIESADLFQRDDFGRFVHLPRLARLLGELDALYVRSRMPPPRLQITYSTTASGETDSRRWIGPVRERLISEANLAPVRFLPPGPCEVEGLTGQLRIVERID